MHVALVIHKFELHRHAEVGLQEAARVCDQARCRATPCCHAAAQSQAPTGGTESNL